MEEDFIIPHPAYSPFRPKVVDIDPSCRGVDPYPEPVPEMRTLKAPRRNWDYLLHRWHLARSAAQKEAIRKMEMEDS